MTDTPPDRCGYCKSRPRGWLRTPRGRPYCPDCKAIPADWQGKPEGKRPDRTGWTDD